MTLRQFSFRKKRLRVFPTVVSIIVVALFYTLAAHSAETLSGGIISLVNRAGNADSDIERRDLLRELRSRDDLPPVFKKDVTELTAFAELWVNPEKEIRPEPEKRSRAAENGFLCWFFKYRDYEERYIYSKIAHDSPLYPLACLYEGRERMWAAFQSGNIWNTDLRDSYLKRAMECFLIADRAFPENRIVRMHLGEPIPWPAYPAVEGAPEWASLQREGLEKLTDIIEWWIDNRMLSNGEFGGGWGDDCEMYRWWTPVLFGFRDEKINAAQEKFSRSLLSQPHHTQGYTDKMSDVEHTAEDTGDTITPMMHVDPDNPEWSRCALRLAELFETVWSGVNEHGCRQFKSTYFNVAEVSPDPLRACDTPRHFAALQPVILYWLRTGDERAGKVVREWMDMWVNATARVGGGKPAGVVPGSVYWPDGGFARRDAVWWEPKNNPEPALYRWPTAVNWVTDTLLQTWWMTGDETYLEPIRSMARIRLAAVADPPSGEPEPGSLDWCADRIGSRINGTLAKYRFLTGQTEFDSLLENDASPYVRYRLYNDSGPLLAALGRNAEAVSKNFEGFTSEVRYTDRVMVWPSRWLGTTGIDPGARSIDSRILYSTVTGDVGDWSYFPMNAVKWLTPPREIAALVTDTGGRFSAELFHFGTDDRPMEAELYLLMPGTYELRLVPEGASRPPEKKRIEVTGSKTRVSFTLPPRRLCRLEVELAE